MADPKMDQLKRVPIFAQCTKKELQSLAQNTDDVTLPTGRTLITQGKSNDTFFVLVEGEADVTVDGKPVGRLKAGDIIGEISMLDRGAATATVVAASPIEALVMSHAQFRDAVRGHEEIAHKVIAVMAERLRRDKSAGI
jgi:CRP/FNR family transcriptional regulator, cyclic AMP receptor protein